MRRTLVSSLAAAACLLGMSAAHAGGNVSWSIGISAPPVTTVISGGPYYPSAPVYVQPQPVYRQPPQAYYYPPAPVYPRGWVQTGYGYGEGNGHGRWERGDGRGWDRDGRRGDDRGDGRGWQGQGRWDHGRR
jgi:hypothetical protein